MSIGQHRSAEQPRLAWVITSLIIGVLMGAALYTVYLGIQANHKVSALVAREEQAAADARDTITCGVHDVVENQRTMLLAIRDLIEPDKGPIPPDVQAILDQMDARLAELSPVSVTGLDCP